MKSKPDTTGKQRSPGRILVIDDDVHVCRVFLRYLEAAGYECHGTNEAVSARSLLQQHEFDVVTLDITMPQCSGTDLLREIKLAWPDVSVVMLTAIADPDTIVASMTDGACGYLLKPVHQEGLLFQVRNALARRREILERRRAENDLIALNQTLEDRVDERTRSLEETNKRLTEEIEQRHRADTALREREARMRAIFDTAADAIITFDESGTIESINPSATRVFGFSAEEILAQNISILIPLAVELTAEGRSFGHLDVDGAEIDDSSKEFDACRKDGSVFPVQMTISEFRSGQQCLFTGIVRDMTHQKQLQCELSQSQKLESVGQLAAGIAHEINTPTQYVGDNTRFLRDAFSELKTIHDLFGALLQAALSGTVDPSLVQKVETAVTEADLEYLSEEIPLAIEQSLDGVDRVASIVRAMKEFSHPGSDEKALVNLHEAIQTTITVARNEWKYVAEMQTEFDPELPSVLCLPGELNQVILNLIVNASHAIADRLGEDTSEKGTITIGTRRIESSAEISIRDTGSGIPQHAQARIFDPFYTTKEVGKGTGQGLAIARSVVVDKHGGSISFETESGQGTTFTIRLPINDQQQSEGDDAHEEAHLICG